MGMEGAAYHGYIPQEYRFIPKPPSWWSFQNSCGPKVPADPNQLSVPERLEAAIKKAKDANHRMFIFLKMQIWMAMHFGALLMQNVI